MRVGWATCILGEMSSLKGNGMGSSLREKYALLAKFVVKMAGYWLNSFFVYLRTETKSRSIRSQKRTKILSSRFHTGHRNLESHGI